MGFEEWKKEIEKEEPGGFEAWKADLPEPKKVYEAPTEWLRTQEVASIPKSLTPIQKAGQAVTEAVAAPVRTIESMLGSIGGLIRMGAESTTIGEVVTKHINMPGVGIIAEHLIRKYGPKKALSFYDRKMQKHADSGKKISDYWNEQANKGWEAPNPDIVEASWKDRPVSKTVSVASSGLTSIGTVVGATFLTKSPHPGLALLAGSETGAMYDRLRNENVPPGIASKLAQMAGAWTYGTEKIGFGRLMKPSKGKILKSLAKPGWEGAQEVAEGIGHNLLEYFGYDYRKPQDIPTAVKAAYDHAMDGWFDNLVGGVSAGGIASVALHRGPRSAAQVTALDDIGKQIERSDAPPQQKEQALQYIGDIETKTEETVVNMFPDEINSQESLERVGDQIAAELGIEGITWKWGTTKKSKIAFYNVSNKIVTVNPEHPVFTKDISGFYTMRGTWIPIENKTPGKLNQDYIKRVIVHELGHGVKVPKRDAVSKIRQISHYAEFFDWVNGNINKMFEQTQQNTIPLHRDEAIGPITAPPTVEDITGKTMDEIQIKAGQKKLKDSPATLIQGNNVDIFLETATKNEVANAVERLTRFYQEFRRQNKAIFEQLPPIQKLYKEAPEGTKLYSPEHLRMLVGGLQNTINTLAPKEQAKAIESADKAIARPVTEITMPEPKKIRRTKKNLTAMAHKIKRDAGLSDNEYSDFAEAVTGKRSMGQMTKTERNDFVAFLEEGFGTVQELSKEDFDIPINVAGRGTTMRQVYNAALGAAEKLKDRKKIPDVIKIGADKPGAIRGLKNFFFGIDNTPPFHLAKILDGGVEGGIFAEVIDKGIEYGRKTTAAHTRSVMHAVMARLQEFGITPADLAKMGKSLNPRLQTHQMISEGAATESFNIKLNDKTYEMTMANLIDVYLMSNQEAGMKHLLGGGLVINGIETGKLSEEQVIELRTRVEEIPKAKKVTDIILEVGELIWKPSLNQVSNRTEGKDIATVKNWWGLEVYMPKILAGKIRTGKLGRFSTNFIENKSILRDRTRSRAPLIVRDAFRRFNAFESAVAEYVGMAEASRTSRTLINDTTISKILDRKGYSDVRKRIFDIHKRAQSVPAAEGNFTAWLAQRLPGLYRAALYFNPRVIASQYTSCFNYGAYVSTEFMTSVKDGLSIKNSLETLELSDIAWDRFHMGHSSLELGEMSQSDAALRMWTGGTSSDINKAGWMLKVSDLGALTAGMEIAKTEYLAAQKDKLTGASAEWWLNKDTSFEEGWTEDEEGNRKVKSEGWRKAVSDRAEYLWQRTQPSWDKWNRSNLTSQKGARRLFLIFRSFHEKSLTIVNDAVLRYENSPKTLDDKGRFIQQTGAVLTSYTVNIFLRLAILALMVRELETPAKYLEEFLIPWVNMFPVFGKVLKSAVNRFIATLAGEKPAYTGEPVESYPIDVINMVLKTPTDLTDGTAHLIAGENEEAIEAYKRGVEKLGQGIGALTGVPVYTIKRILPKGQEKKKEYKL